MMSLLLAALLLPTMERAQAPDWYAGRHGVMIIVDGLGDGELERLRGAGQLQQTQAALLASGQQLRGAAAHWPGRGAAEAHGIASGRRLGVDPAPELVKAQWDGWPAGSWLFAPDTAGGLDQLLRALPAAGSAQLPPVIAVAHDSRYAVALGAHGAQHAAARAALEGLDRSLAGVVERYRALGVAGQTAWVLVAPSAVQQRINRLDAAHLFAPVLTRRGADSERLGTLLHAFAPVQVVGRGSLAFAALPERAPGVESPADAASGDRSAPTLDDLFRAAETRRRPPLGLLQEIQRSPGVAYAVARINPTQPHMETVLVIGPDGAARIDTQGEDQLRVTRLQGEAPLQLRSAFGVLDGRYFHPGIVWRGAQGSVYDAPERFAHLLQLVDGAALAAVAAPGAVFDEATHAAGADGHALVVWSGLGTPAASPPPIRVIDLMPSLLATLGAPLSDALEGEVIEETVEVTITPTLEQMCAELRARASHAFDTHSRHDATVIDTTGLRRFGAPPPYFESLRQAVDALEPTALLPPADLQRQIGPRRALLVATAALAAAVERKVIQVAPAEVRRFDTILRPEQMLAGFLDDPEMRSRLWILEGPYLRLRQRAEALAEKRGAPSP